MGDTTEPNSHTETNDEANRTEVWSVGPRGTVATFGRLHDHVERDADDASRLRSLLPAERGGSP